MNHYPIRSIVHKYLQRGHSQNEGDTIHSNIGKVLKKARRCGAIYVPDQYVSLIQQANKKLAPIHVNELSFENFYDLKTLFDELRVKIEKNEQGDVFKISEVRKLKFEKGSEVFWYKNSFKKETEWQSVRFTPKRISPKKYTAMADVELKPAYTKTLTISENKKRDLKALCDDCTIPPYYRSFYESIYN